MSIYNQRFIPSKYYKELLIQHQIGFNLTVDSYLLINCGHTVTDSDDIDSILNKNHGVVVIFEGIKYDENGWLDVGKYNTFKSDYINHTSKIERYTPRNDYFEFSIPITKDKYNIYGEQKINLIALFGHNYNGDKFNNGLVFLGFLYFEKNYIPLYNTREKGIQINSVFNMKIDFSDGEFTIKDSGNVNMMYTYYDYDSKKKGINIFGNIVLE